MKTNIIFDGALGTYLAAKNLHLDFPEMANITDKDTVFTIHKEYIASGINAIKTNTFGANSTLITDFSLLKSIIKSGFAIANRAAANTSVKVFADIGPIHAVSASDEYKKVVDIFIDCGATNFLFETMYEISGLKECITYIKDKIPNAVIITSFAVGQDGYTRLGKYYKVLFDQATLFGADHVGLNCICGPAHMLNLIKAVPPKKYSLAAMPNAGYPTIVNGRTVYVDNAEYFSEKLFEIYSLGVEVVGGCCGTTPEHIRRFTKRIEAFKPQEVQTPITQSHINTVAKNDFENTVIAVEIPAPLNVDISYTLAAAEKAKQLGADFITIPDSPLGKTRANSFMISSLIQRRVGIKAIPHLCCRDKNQIAIRGDLVAANIDGISNVLALTGDSVAESDRNEAKNVFGFNSFKLMGFIKSLNNTVFTENPYNICAALNINAANFDSELARAENKIAEGAICFFTQPILSEKNIENYFKAKARLDCKILAGIMLLAGYKNSLFLNNEVSGIEIPDKIIKLFKDKNPADTRDISVNYACSIVDRIKENCDGFYIMTAMKKIDFLSDLIKHIRREIK